VAYEEALHPQSVAAQGVEARARFISRVYTHLFGAIVAFTILEVVLYKAGIPERLFAGMGRSTGFVMFGVFVVGGWLARGLAQRTESLPLQYVGLSLYVLLWTGLFMPILWVAATYPRFEGAIESAVYLTLFLFAGLTAIVFYTRKDFSFLGSLLMWGGLCALAAIVASWIFGFTLGPIFMVAMIALSGAAILFDTSNVIHHYNERQYVGAALELFSSVALMFFYVLQLIMSMRE